MTSTPIIDRHRPLIVCDIDEVVLEFLTPFDAFLRSQRHELVPQSFRLHGNIRSLEAGMTADDSLVEHFQESFFLNQNQWQHPVSGALEALDRLAGEADIVFLTAMPPRHRDVRQKLLASHGFGWPMIATEEPKGPVVAELSATRSGPVVFLDDMARNLRSVRDHVPHCLLLNIMANQIFWAMAPDPGEGIHRARNWEHAFELIDGHFKAFDLTARQVPAA